MLIFFFPAVVGIAISVFACLNFEWIFAILFTIPLIPKLNTSEIKYRQGNLRRTFYFEIKC